MKLVAPLLLTMIVLAGTLLSCSAAPKPVQYLVFFTYGQSEVTPEAGYVLEEVVYAAKTKGFRSIVITGHCDTAEESQPLSLQRATAVARRLWKLGLPKSVKVQVGGLGSTALLVTTEPNKREPRNRFAAIDMK